ncbi:MAG TPA: hypothetical protein VGM32_08385 [Rhodopila sp.]|jgi:hypothetical protein
MGYTLAIRCPALVSISGKSWSRGTGRNPREAFAFEPAQATPIESH